MEIDSVSGKENGDETKPKALLVLLMGAPGSGKSTFCDNVMRASSRPWVRICQDTINKGKSGTKAQCLTSAVNALKERKSIFIDRCNLDKDQRADFVKLGSSQVDVHAVVLDLPAKLCISRCINRTGHEGNLQGGKAAAVVNRMLQKKELPKLDEGYSRITLCHNDNDVQDTISKYSALGSSDILPPGCFGQKSQDAKAPVGIMKFFKKVDPGTSNSDVRKTKASSSNGLENDQDLGGEVKRAVPVLIPNEELGGGDNMVIDSAGADTSRIKDHGNLPSPDEVPTLAFPSISTADFKFDLEKASDIIVEEVQEWLPKVGKNRVVLVDLTHNSRILSLVKAKAAQKNIDSSRFFTFVGDITQLYSKGGLRCCVIANATNWRLKPGGGGVNAAIFSAAGPSLKTATEQQAKSLLPGKAVVVPLPSTSPLYSKEGVTHVIHVLGPNMNPQRPNYLNDYEEGCKILRQTYRSLFEGFTSIVKNQSISSKLNACKSEEQPSNLCDQNVGKRENYSPSDHKTKRETDHEVERNKKSKGNPNARGGEVHDRKADKEGSAAKKWGSWAQSLYNIAMHPEKHESDVLEITSDVVVINDLYPKAKKHILVLSRLNGLDSLKNVHQEHLKLLRTMHEVGIKSAEKLIVDDPSLVFRMGYHSVPSMRQLHLHVISQDFDSPCLKNKKHWNSFTTTFFRDSVDVINEITKYGNASVREDETILSMELRCHRCRSAHPNIPLLKSHISRCQAQFPQALLEDNRLIGKHS